MPAMKRFDKKATKIAFTILGKPTALNRPMNAKEKKINLMLLQQEARRIR